MGKYEEGGSAINSSVNSVSASLDLNNLLSARTPRRNKKAPEDFTKYFQMLGEMTELCGRKSSNFMYSPASLYSALQAAAYGTDGKTYEEIIKLTGKKTYDLKSEAVNVCNFLVVNGKEGRQAKIREEYEQRLKTDQNLYATIYELTDENCDQLVNEINSRCGRETNGQIVEAVQDEDFQDASPLDPFMAFLGNVLHFKGTWKERCRLEKYFYFTGLDGERRRVDAVEMDSDELHYYCNETVEAFSAPYLEANGRYTFWGFLPSGNGNNRMSQCQSVHIGAAEVESPYTGKMELCDISRLDLTGLSEPEEKYKLYVEIPKFLFRSGMDMTEALKKFGVKDAFDRQKADFSKGYIFSKDNNVYLNSVHQQTVIDFNEKGTEASAFTGLTFDVACMCIRGLEIRLDFDRPFYFMIWDEIEKLPLFVGQVFEPARMEG
ncbi:MAG: hypothetical protein LUC95_01740 [Lachnospiraceae bacterium]|nr:hypothetical protein [Lachnospiraceae bacterium]